uniref:Uncharacterized protein n=1 Tax=Nelumbo nucifera TaxID=4432 RepID=A0A822YMF5_NELNU|nr:TPA_asm: hypothetical protein HUJ06_012553 [Nelumbo nucifera]
MPIEQDGHDSLGSKRHHGRIIYGTDRLGRCDIKIVEALQPKKSCNNGINYSYNDIVIEGTQTIEEAIDLEGNAPWNIELIAQDTRELVENSGKNIIFKHIPREPSRLANFIIGVSDPLVAMAFQETIERIRLIDLWSSYTPRLS